MSQVALPNSNSWKIPLKETFNIFLRKKQILNALPLALTKTSFDVKQELSKYCENLLTLGFGLLLMVLRGDHLDTFMALYFYRASKYRVHKATDDLSNNLFQR
jgi:hypothetical protein